MQTLDKKQQNKIVAPGPGKRNADRDTDYNKSKDEYRNPDTRTFNEDEESWEKRKTVGSRHEYHYDDEQRDAGDYINCDRSNYNRGNCRFGWFEPEDF